MTVFFLNFNFQNHLGRQTICSLTAELLQYLIEMNVFNSRYSHVRRKRKFLE